MGIVGTLQDFLRQMFVESPTRPGSAIPEVSAIISGVVNTVTTEITTVRLQNQSLYRVQDGQIVRTVYDGNMKIRVLDGGSSIVKVS